MLPLCESVLKLMCPFQTCLNFQCVAASALLPNLTCNAQTTCSGRGVRWHSLVFLLQVLPNKPKSDFATGLFCRYVITKGTATVKTGGAHSTVTGRGEVAALTVALLR